VIRGSSLMRIAERKMVSPTRVGVVSDGLGNVGPLMRAIAFHGFDATLIESVDDVRDVDVIILVSVGNFKTAGRNCEMLDSRSAETWAVEDKLPLLSICLGMQLFRSPCNDIFEGTRFGTSTS
jgi:glutamine amidotransferase